MLLISFSVVISLPAQVALGADEKESADSTFYEETGSPGTIKFELPDNSLMSAIQLRSCVNTFTGQTVSSIVSVLGCNILTVQSVTVTGSGNLSLTAPAEVVINGPFDVSLGGILSVCDGSQPPSPPPGNTMQTAINIGTFGGAFQYSDTQNTVNFTNDYVGRPTNDVFYTFTITAQLDVTIKHCDSQVNDTYLHLLNSSGASIGYNDDYSGPGACGNTNHSYLKMNLSAGTYYIVSEGYSVNGNIKTWVTGEIPQLNFNYTYDASGNRINRTY